jgi:hypothetical protein
MRRHGRGGDGQRFSASPDRGRRNWKKNPRAREAVYRNRRRIRGPTGRPAPGAAPRRAPRTAIRAPLRNKRDAPVVPARAHQRSEAPLIQAGGFNLGPAHGWPWSPPRRLQGRLVAEPRGAADADLDAPRAYIAASGHDRIRGPSRIDRSITCRLRRICRLFTCRTPLPLRRVVCTGCARWRCRTL